MSAGRYHGLSLGLDCDPACDLVDPGIIAQRIPNCRWACWAQVLLGFSKQQFLATAP